MVLAAIPGHFGPAAGQGRCPLQLARYFFVLFWAQILCHFGLAEGRGQCPLELARFVGEKNHLLGRIHITSHQRLISLGSESKGSHFRWIFYLSNLI